MPRVPRETKVREVFALLLEGRSEPEIVEAIASKWRDDPRPLILEAMAYLADPALDDGLAVTRWAIEATREVYRKALGADDLPTARSCVRQIADLAHRLPRAPGGPIVETNGHGRKPKRRRVSATVSAHGREVDIGEL